MDKSKTIVIDPSIFIRPPYIKCPKCNTEASFGVLMISRRTYTRRCKKCFQSETFRLPEIQKKVIYLDQFVISNMMKALNKNSPAYQAGRVDPFYKELFGKIDRLCKLQLIICPDSNNHFYESIVTGFYPQLKRVYEHFSHGTTLHDPDTVIRFQIMRDFKRWLGEATEELTIHDFTEQEINEWQERFIISVELTSQDPNLPDQVRKERDSTSDYLNSVFTRWQKESNKTFKDWYEEEQSAFGKMIINRYLKNLADQLNLSLLDDPSSLFKVFSLSSSTIYSMQNILEEKGIAEDQIPSRIIEYLLSEDVKKIPFVNISSSIYAGLARSAATGRKKPLTKGMANDVEVISAYAPYCDAMFVDNECAFILSQEPLKLQLKLDGKIFSLNNKDKFIEYLDSIEKESSKEHIQLVKEVYGENWVIPYWDLFDYPTE